jgi:hypothetical protein
VTRPALYATARGWSTSFRVGLTVLGGGVAVPLARGQAQSTEATMSENWTGVEGSTEHRTVGSHRAWCYQDNEWCYPNIWCDCCYEAAGYEKRWVPATKGGDDG